MRYQSDYVLRVIEQMGGLIRRALEQLRLGSDEEPIELAEQALGLALDMDPMTVSRLSPASLASFLALNLPDERVLDLVVEALDVEAEALEGRGEIVLARLRREQAEAVRHLLDPASAN